MKQDTIFVKARDGQTEAERAADVLVELKLRELRQSTERPTLWCCPECGKTIDRDPEHRGKWVVCIGCQATQFIDPELSLN
jgi:rubrerythrin